jgi:hypothetical protein
MHQSIKKQLYSFSAGLFLVASLMSSSSAQSPAVIELKKPAAPITTYIQMEEPARWTQEDITVAQKYSTATKESSAALYEAMKICENLDPSQRSHCISQARSIYQVEMSEIRARFGK